MQEEHDSVIRKIKNRKAAGLDERPPEVWKTRQFDDILLRHYNVVYNQNTIDRRTKGYNLLFSKKGDLGLAKNYRGIALTSIAAKTYNTLLRNHIEPKIEKILRRTEMVFGQIDPQIMNFDYPSNSGCTCKKPKGNNIICRLLRGLWLHTQSEDGANTTCLRPTQRNRRSHNDAI